MAIKIVEQSADEMVLRSRPYLAWGMASFYLVLCILMILVIPGEASLVCDRQATSGQCEYIGRSPIINPSPPEHFEISQWQGVDTEYDESNNRTAISLVVGDKELSMGRVDDDAIDPGNPAAVRRMRQFLESDEQQTISIAVGNEVARYFFLGITLLFGIGFLATGAGYKTRISRVDNELQVTKKRLWGQRTQQWPADELEAAQVRVQAGKITTYHLELVTRYAEHIPIDDGSMAKKKRYQLSDELNEFFEPFPDADPRLPPSG